MVTDTALGIRYLTVAFMLFINAYSSNAISQTYYYPSPSRIEQTKNLAASIDLIERNLNNLYFNKGIASDNEAWSFTAYLERSEFGQFFGKVFGTKNQSYRNSIDGAKALMVPSIAKLKGMSGENAMAIINSTINVSHSYQSNMGVIEVLKRQYNIPKSNHPSTYFFSARVKQFEWFGGYMYNGGDPGDPESWLN